MILLESSLGPSGGENITAHQTDNNIQNEIGKRNLWNETCLEILNLDRRGEPSTWLPRQQLAEGSACEITINWCKGRITFSEIYYSREFRYFDVEKYFMCWQLFVYFLHTCFDINSKFHNFQIIPRIEKPLAQVFSAEKL